MLQQRCWAASLPPSGALRRGAASVCDTWRLRAFGLLSAASRAARAEARAARLRTQGLPGCGAQDEAALSGARAPCTRYPCAEALTRALQELRQRLLSKPLVFSEHAACRMDCRRALARRAPCTARQAWRRLTSRRFAAPQARHARRSARHAADGPSGRAQGACLPGMLRSAPAAVASTLLTLTVLAQSTPSARPCPRYALQVRACLYIYTCLATGACGAHCAPSLMPDALRRHRMAKRWRSSPTAPPTRAWSPSSTPIRTTRAARAEESR